jgi:hypothetical protein
MELLLITLAVAFATGVRARDRDKLPPAWMLIAILTVVALAYLARRVI